MSLIIFIQTQKIYSVIRDKLNDKLKNIYILVIKDTQLSYRPLQVLVYAPKQNINRAQIY